MCPSNFNASSLRHASSETKREFANKRGDELKLTIKDYLNESKKISTGFKLKDKYEK